MAPNVVLFNADDIGNGDVSASGFPTTLVSTPHIDALAASGVLFTRMHSGGSLCAPSRYSLLSGNHPARGTDPKGAWYPQSRSMFRDGQLSIGHLFRGAGYTTAIVGSR